MTPKRVLDVMNGEVNRLYQLSKNMITPLPYIIPRKSYRDFQPDLFPDTVYSGTPAMSAEEWFAGGNVDAVKLSLDPNKKESKKPPTTGLKPKSEPKSDVSSPPGPVTSESVTPAPAPVSVPTSIPEASAPVPPPPTPVDKLEGSNGEVEAEAVVKPNKPTKISSSFTSKFRHMVGEPLHKNNNIENIKNLCESLPSESNGGQVNDDLVALAMSGSGGQIAVCQLSKPGRLPECDIPTVVNGCNVLDFAMDPFDSRNVAVGCEDWHVRVWELPEDGLTQTLDQPKHVLSGNWIKYCNLFSILTISWYEHFTCI